MTYHHYSRSFGKHHSSFRWLLLDHQPLPEQGNCLETTTTNGYRENWSCMALQRVLVPTHLLLITQSHPTSQTKENIVPWYYGPEMHLLCKVCKLSNHTYLQKKSLLHMCAFILRQLGWNYEWIITVYGICNSLEDAHILLLLISSLPSIYPSIYLYVNLHKCIYCVSLTKSKRIKCL